MCCSWEKKKLQCWGMILSVGFLVGAIVCIILAGVNYNITNVTYTEGGWKTLAAVQVASIVYVFSTCVIGFLTFCCDWWFLTLLVSFLFLTISLLFFL